MGIGGIAYIFGSSMLVKFLQNEANVAVVDIGGELAIRKSARSAFSKLHIGIGIELLVMKKFGYLRLSVFNATASFNNHRFRSAAGQIQGSEHAGGTESHHYRSMLMGPLWVSHGFRSLV